jgi:hypothetical protein
LRLSGVLLLILLAAWLQGCRGQNDAQRDPADAPLAPAVTTTPRPTDTSPPDRPTSSPQEQTPPTATPQPLPTFTPDPTSPPTNTTSAAITDSAAGLPDSEVWLIIVLRADGHFDQYRIPAEQVRAYLMGNPPDYAGYQALIDSIVHLQAGDSIYAANDADTPGLVAPPRVTPP